MWPTIATALLIAGQVWGPASCGTPQVVWQAQLPADPPFTRTLAWADPESCSILLNRTDRRVRTDSAYRCTLIVHEWGHLTGHQHSNDPNNVMYPWIAREYWRCLKPKDRWFLRALRPTH